VTAAYNIFGGVPLTLSLLNLIMTTILAMKGYLSSSLLLYLASLLQFSSISLVLNVIAEYPLILLAVAYLWGAVGSFLSLIFISKLYEDDRRLSRVALSAVKYSFFVPLVLWLQALVMVPAVVAAIRDLIRGSESRW
jgi:hypothetical protein